MTRLQKALVTCPMLALLLAAGGRTLTASATNNTGDKAINKVQAWTLPLISLDGLEVQSIREDGVDPLKTKADVATYRGRRAVRVINEDGLTATGAPAGAQAIAIVRASNFKDGTIEADVVGVPREGAPPTTRGFVGIAFRVQSHGSRYESIYLRMLNARADDQLQRNHSTQYVSQPDFTWQRLRKENPGLYESYVDLEPGAWTRIKIVVAGTKANLYVNGASQPCLIVNDLKLGEIHGQVALWIGSNSEAYFSNLMIRYAEPPILTQPSKTMKQLRQARMLEEQACGAKGGSSHPAGEVGFGGVASSYSGSRFGTRHRCAFQSRLSCLSFLGPSRIQPGR